MSRAYQVAVIGLGKIAIDQHLPAIAAIPDFQLAATVDPNPGSALRPTFGSIEALLASGIKLDAVAVCTPPQVRAGIASRAIDAGLAVMLEKPPAATLDDFAALKRQAESSHVTLFTAWHSRFAPMVDAARAWLEGRVIIGGQVDWREDVRRWHPGQRWLWQPGGLGVFDPGINAFSILTEILPTPPVLVRATLDVPENVHTPIAAELTLGVGNAAIDVALDFLNTGMQAWDIRLETQCGHRLRLSEGGASLSIDDGAPRVGASAEYPALYARFAELIAAGESDADAAPYSLAADSLSLGTVRRVAAFIE